MFYLKNHQQNNKLLDNSYCIHLWESHLQEKLLSKLTSSYFMIYNTIFLIFSINMLNIQINLYYL